MWIETEGLSTNELLAAVVRKGVAGERVKFLVPAGTGVRYVTRLRTALSRSRMRNRAYGKKVKEFTLLHTIFPYTKDSKRNDCVVMWIERTPRHALREHLDDILER